MADELGARERRYLEAYLELESQASTPRADAPERTIAAMLAEAAPTDDWELAPRRSRSLGVLLVAGLGLCAAMALAWWAGRASLVEEHAGRAPVEAPHVMRGDRRMHEASSRGAAGRAEPRSSQPLPPAASEHAPTPARAASPERSEHRGPARPHAEPRPTPARPPSIVEPELPVPTLSNAEVAQLERARRLAQRGEHAEALAVLREHVRRYPSSVLGPERTAEAVAVLCRMGAPSAPSARASFLAGHPPHYLRTRVEKACGP